MCVCMLLQRTDSQRTDGSLNQRLPVSQSALANKWFTQRRSMTVQFQALHFAIYGPNFHHETCHRNLNVGLIQDAMRRVLDHVEYQDFVHDARQEMNNEEGIDGMR